MLVMPDSHFHVPLPQAIINSLERHFGGKSSLSASFNMSSFLRQHYKCHKIWVVLYVFKKNKLKEHCLDYMKKNKRYAKPSLSFLKTHDCIHLLSFHCHLKLNIFLWWSFVGTSKDTCFCCHVFTLDFGVPCCVCHKHIPCYTRHYQMNKTFIVVFELVVM